MKNLINSIRNKKIIIFGAGVAGDLITKYISTNVAYYVDNDKNKWGRKIINDKVVYSPQILELERKNEIFILVASIYFYDIIKQLKTMGFIEGDHFLNVYGLISQNHTKKISSSNSVYGQLFFPLIKKNVILNGVNLSLVTHQQDRVLGSMLRGEKEVCKYYLAELEFLQNSIKPYNKVLDAGANIGSVAIILAKVEPSATIYCFEPDPLNYSLLNINILLNKVSNVRTFNYALGKRQEFIDLYLNKVNFGDHRSSKTQKNDLNEAAFKILPSKVLKVNPYETLKKSLNTEFPDHFDLVKIDTQGADFEILEACIPLLKKGSIVATEYSPYHLDANGTTKNDVERVLKFFSSINKVNPIGQLPRISSIDTGEIMQFYDEQYEHYRTHYDLVLNY